MMNGRILQEATLQKAASHFFATCCNYQGVTREREKQFCLADPSHFVSNSPEDQNSSLNPLFYADLEPRTNAD